MTQDVDATRRAVRVGLGALAVFWLLVLVSGRLQPGYDPARDFVSALVSEGARLPVLGIVALLAFGVAYLAAAFVLDRWVGTRLGAVLLTLAGALTWVVALARIDCPGGAARCGLSESFAVMAGSPKEATLIASDGDPFTPMLHGWAVGVSYGLVAVTMLVLAVVWWRGARRGAAVWSAAALVTSLLTVPFWLASDAPGFAQRVWLGILTAWVVLLLVQPSLDGRGAEEARE